MEQTQGGGGCPRRFFAVEYFTNVPKTCFVPSCSISWHQARFAREDHHEETNHPSWTFVSPLYCAGFNHCRTRNAMAIIVKSDGRFQGTGCDRFGVGIIMKNFYKTKLPIHLGMLRKMIKRELFAYHWSRRKAIVVGGYQCYDETHGILGSNISQTSSQVLVYCKDAKVQQQELLKSPILSVQTGEGLDLFAYGVAIVFDNSSALHFTLVHLGESVKSAWVLHPTLNVQVPVGCIYMSKEEVLSEIFSSEYDRARFN